jgi:rsbT co-antagonist protein RsbR
MATLDDDAGDGPDSATMTTDLRALRERCASQDMLNALPDPTAIVRVDGMLMAHNDAYRELWRLPPQHELIGRLNLLEAKGVDPSHVQAMLRAREGERVFTPTVRIDLSHDPVFAELERKVQWIEVTFAPLRVDGVIRFVLLSFRDRSDDVANQSRVVETEATVAAQRATIEALHTAQEHIREQQATIRELSTPIIEVWPGVLTLPVVGHIDERRAGEMTMRLLTSVTTMRARHVILDLTGVERLDPATADHLLRILRAVPLLGARTMITGIHPDVARTFVELGLDLRTIHTVGTVRSALAEIIGERGVARVV